MHFKLMKVIGRHLLCDTLYINFCTSTLVYTSEVFPCSLILYLWIKIENF